ncbi:hypothetical protein [Pseudomonas sp.]|uniref:hypothetical protein n=1 Tax=Pseudomonas sp. TaxID=306 RepID=UPI00299EF154|nr:hypothetical protein [Pseudomonas sp.]MDX1370142.1 hypothetical protein [Pseudomonas sp.]
MGLSDKEKQELLRVLDGLTNSQQRRIQEAIVAYARSRRFWRLPDSDFVTEGVLDDLGDRLLTHHANSRQALSKDRFEYALEASLNAAGIEAALEKNPTNRGHDITIDGVPVNLKTQANAAIREDRIHVSKWMELGRGAWDIDFQRQQFLAHLQGYDRIFTMRCLSKELEHVKYEFVEIPKSLLLESATAPIEHMANSTQSLIPAYVKVRDATGGIKFELYFDAGGERKLQVKNIRKDLCRVHATWEFGSEIDA